MSVLHGALAVCLWLHMTIVYNSHIELGSSLFQCDLILTNYICKEPISKTGLILWY